MYAERLATEVINVSSQKKCSYNYPRLNSTKEVILATFSMCAERRNKKGSLYCHREPRVMYYGVDVSESVYHEMTE